MIKFDVKLSDVLRLCGCKDDFYASCLFFLLFSIPAHFLVETDIILNFLIGLTAHVKAEERRKRWNQTNQNLFKVYA